MTLAFSNGVITEVSDFEHAVAQIPDGLLLDATALVLRVHARAWLEMDSGEAGIVAAMQTQADAVSKRAPGVDVYVVPDGHSAAEARPPYAARHGPRLLIDGKRAKASFVPVDNNTVLEIRQQDLAKCLEVGRSRCVICATSNYHFELPSGAHASQFMRLAEAFVDIETVDRVAYWVALEIQSKISPLQNQERYALLVDNPSMLVLASRVQRLVSVSLEIVAFPTYPSDVEARAALFDLLRKITPDFKTVFVLIGVASTGRLAAFIQRWSAGASAVNTQTSVLYSLCELGSLNVLCRLTLPDYQHFAEKADCALCAAQSAPVRIQASNYMVGHQPSAPVPLPKKFFQEQREFLERWGRCNGVLRVHYNDPNESTARHHAFYVDVASLLDESDFEQRVVAAARAFAPSPDIVLAPDHPTALRIAKLVSTVLSIPHFVLDSQLLSKGVGQPNATLGDSSCVLVLDDVFITGSRLDVINRFLREHKDTHAPSLKRIHYWTLLATPSSSKHYQRAKDGLTSNHDWQASLTHLYQFALPDWHGVQDCPWCTEFAVLSGLAQASGNFEGPLVDRLAELASPTTGMTDSTYFVSPQQRSGPLPDLGAESATLGKGASPLQVLFACASAVQQLRHADKNSLNADQFPAPAYLAERVFSTNYTERLIWLGLLRSLKSKELEPSLKTYLTKAAMFDDQRAVIQGELVVAWLTGKLDAIPASMECRRAFAEAGINWGALFENGLVDGSQLPDPEMAMYRTAPRSEEPEMSWLRRFLERFLERAKRLVAIRF